MENESSEKHYENFLEEFDKSKCFVRICSHGDSHLGKIVYRDKIRLYLSPHIVYENLIINNNEVIVRARIEKNYQKAIPNNFPIIEPLTEEYFEEVIKIGNYFNSLKIKSELLRQKFFNSNVYLMPDKDLTNLLNKKSK